MLLNKIPALDKGYVAFISSSLNGKEMRQIEDNHFSGKINRDLWEVASLTLEIRCPLFVQMFIQQFGLKVINTIESKVECYIPDISEIHTGDHATDKDISEYMEQTSKALLLTAEAMEKDGLDRFISNTMMPISVYNTIIVSGNLQQWIKLLKKKAPHAISTYQNTIYDIAINEWDELNVFIGRTSGKKEKIKTETKK